MNEFQPPLQGAAGDPGEEFRYREATELDPSTPGQLEALLGHLDDPSWRVRAAAAGRLGQGDPARVVPALVASLAGGGTGRRSAAAGALVLVGAPAAPAVLQALAGDSVELRIAAAEVLGDLGEPRAAFALAHHLADSEPNVRQAAAGALGVLGGAAAVDALERASREEDPGLQRAALDGLLRLRAPLPFRRLAELASDKRLRRLAFRLAGASSEPAVGVLLARGLEDPSRAVREAALAGLGQQRLDRGGLPADALAALREVAARQPATVAAAEGALGDEDAALRAGALLLLGEARASEAARSIAAAAEDEVLRPLVSEALLALGPSAVPVLRGQLPALSPVARVVAAHALARLGEAAGLAELLAALGGEPGAARSAAFEALGQLGDRRAVVPLSALLEGEDSAEAMAALSELAASPAGHETVLAACRERPLPLAPGWARLMGRVGEPRDLPALLASLATTQGRDAVAAAVATLSARLPPCATPPAELVAALEDPDAAVRGAAAQALGELSGRQESADAAWSAALRGLALALCDGEPSVRAAAALALGRSGARECAPALAELAGDWGAPPEVAAAAVRALSEMSEATAELLDRAAGHVDAEVAKEAVRAAAGLPGTAAADLLLRAARHQRWDVRRAAALALAERGDPALLDEVRRVAGEEGDALVARALVQAERALEAAGRPAPSARGREP